MDHGVSGHAWIWDRNMKLKLRDLSLSLLDEDEDIHEPGLLTPVKAAKEAAKEDQIVNAARAKVADFMSRAALATAPVPGATGPAVGGSAPPAALAFAPQDSSSARSPSALAPGP